jgi:cobalamin synthase
MLPDSIGKRAWDRLYSAFFLIVVFIWPIGLLERALEEGKPVLAAIPILNTLLLLLVWYSCSQPDLSLFRGMAVISYSSHTGCIQLTWVILPYALAGGLSAGLLFSLLGIFRGRAFAQKRWLDLVTGLYHRALCRR